MSHPVCKVKSFAIVRPYTLKVGFDDGLSREIDFRPILQGELYGPLRDLRLFEQVALDSEVHTLWYGPMARILIPRPSMIGLRRLRWLPRP